MKHDLRRDHRFMPWRRCAIAMLEVMVLFVLSMGAVQLFSLWGDVAFCEAAEGILCGSSGCVALSVVEARASEYEGVFGGLTVLLLGGPALLRLSQRPAWIGWSGNLFLTGLAAISLGLLIVAWLGPGLGITEGLPWTEHAPLHRCNPVAGVYFAAVFENLGVLASIVLGSLAILLRVALMLRTLWRDAESRGRDRLPNCGCSSRD